MLLWSGFIALILVFLALDLGVFNRKDHVIGIKEALRWSAVWASLAIAFSVFVYFAYELHWFNLGTAVDAVDGRVNSGTSAAWKYLTGYLIEQSLSVDNLFVIALIFGSFGVPAIYRHRVLFWGIIGALVMRGVMIGIGAGLITRFHWLLYVFGGFLMLTAIKMVLAQGIASNLADNIMVRLARRFFPVTDRYHGNHFFVRAGSVHSKESPLEGTPSIRDSAVDRQKPGTWMLTPLAIALLMVETTDLIFAVDSIPAIFAITSDPFIIFTSNIFAILGLRSLFFALAGMLDKFHYLKYSLAAILFIVGAKMFCGNALQAILGEWFNLALLGVIVAILAIGVLASFRRDRRLRVIRTRL